MDDYSGMWNPKRNSDLEEECQSSMGPINQQIWYPPPPLQQHFQPSADPYFSYSSISYPPPPLPPPSGPPLVAFSPAVPPPQLGASHFYPLSSTVKSETEQCERDKEWLRHWLSQSRVQPALKNSVSPNNFKLTDIHLTLVKCSSAIKELQQLHQQLSTLSSCADEAKWDSLMAEVNDRKAALALLVSKVRSLDLPAIKSKLSKRAKKRGRLRRKKDKVKELKQAEQARRKILHQRADAWLAEMRLAVEREHREEELRREADAVLGEVTRKQNEAKRQVSLLDALIKLRQLRAQRAAMDFYNQDVVADHSAKKFATVIERLRKMWSAQLKEYAGEERGLRVMLHESAAQKSDARCQRVKSTLDKWHKAIFGQSASRSTSKTDINQLLIVRAEWDKYVVPHSGAAHAPMASSIPVGWLIPQEPSSALWRPYCAAYIKDN